MPTGWRPADVAATYPVYKIADVYRFDKYETLMFPGMRVWLWIQLMVLLLFLSYLFGNIAAIGVPGIFIYGLFIFLFVYAFAELMDNHSNAWVWELFKLLCGSLIIFYTGDWFGLNSVSVYLNYIIVAYLLLSAVIHYYFCLNLKKARIPINH